MSQKFLRPLRIIAALLFIISTSLIFLDIKEKIPLKSYDYILYPQFVPSLINFLKGITFITSGFIMIVLLSLLFGRVYCSFICPLGIFQDMISFLSKKMKFIKRFKYKKGLSIIRYSILTVTILFFIFNIIFFVTLLDPYSNFGRIMNGLIRPLLIVGNNILAAVFEKMNIYYFAPISIKTNLLAIVFPLILVAILIWMAGKRGRLFCNTICPVGTLLGILSRFSLFKLMIDKNSCTSCGKCAFSCKAECINIKDQQVDMTRCVGCMNCITSCETDDIQFKFVGKTENSVVDSKKRSFISKSAGSFLLFMGISSITKSQDIDSIHIGKKYKPTKNSYKKDHHVSPPGSESHEHFNSLCTGCNLCVSVCPTKVLQPSTLEYGLKGFLQPHMDYYTNYCNFDCTRCSEVCPTGAILPILLEEKKTKQLGKVIFIKENCVVYTEETACGSCAEHCPTKAVHMIPYKGSLTIPETNDKICIGCGACEYACPMKPFKAIYVNGHDVHQTAEKPKIEALEEDIIEDFPF